MMKMLETQVAQLTGRLSSNEGKLPGQPQGPKTAKAIQTRSGKETEEPEHAVGARKPKPRVEVETKGGSTCFWVLSSKGGHRDRALL